MRRRITRTRWRFLKRLVSFVSAHEGIAAVEFALIMPILIALMVGGLEVARFVNTTRQLTNLDTSKNLC